MFYGKTYKQVSLVGELLMTNNPYWFNNHVVFFEDDNHDQYPEGMISFYEIFVEQLDIKLYEEQFEDSLTSSSACFFFRS